MAATLLDILPGLLPMLAGGSPVCAAGDKPVSCEVHGDDSSIALFVMGRISADRRSLTVTDLATARAFRQYLPGP